MIDNYDSCDFVHRLDFVRRLDFIHRLKDDAFSLKYVKKILESMLNLISDKSDDFVVISDGTTKLDIRLYISLIDSYLKECC